MIHRKIDPSSCGLFFFKGVPLSPRVLYLADFNLEHEILLGSVWY